MKISVFSKNFLSLLGSTFVVQAVRFLTISLLARRLGANVFGVYSYIILLITYGFTIVEFGLKNLAIREISQGRSSADFVPKILKIRSTLALFGAMAVVCFSYLAFPNGEYIKPSFIFGLSLLADAFLVDFIVIAKEKLQAQAVANISQALFVYVASFILVKNENHFTLFSEIFLLSHLVWVGLFYLYAKPFFKTLKGNSEFVYKTKALVSQGIPFLVAQFLFSMQASTDLLLLGQFHYTHLLGEYSAAMKILGIPTGVVFALMATVYPKIAKYSDDFQAPKLHGLLEATTHLIWIFILPMVIGSWLFGDELIRWFFGAGYKGAIVFLKPLSISMGLYFLSLPPMVALLVCHNTKLMVGVSATNLGVSFSLSFVALLMGRPDLLPWVMVLAQGFGVIFSWLPFKKKNYLSLEEVRTLLLPSVLMTVFLILPSLNPPLRFLCGALGYTGGLCIFKIWQKPWVKTFQEREV